MGIHDEYFIDFTLYHYFIYNTSPACVVHIYDATVKLSNAKF
jgi:hypothetical protein